MNQNDFFMLICGEINGTTYTTFAHLGDSEGVAVTLTESNGARGYSWQTFADTESDLLDILEDFDTARDYVSVCDEGFLEDLEIDHENLARAIRESLEV